ncbi:hypothetical protein WAI453_010468 [Rhynchosporium graminicola]
MVPKSDLNADKEGAGEEAWAELARLGATTSRKRILVLEPADWHVENSTGRMLVKFWTGETTGACFGNLDYRPRGSGNLRQGLKKTPIRHRAATT